jgi:aldehyde:ferredoxin oxidoreductase
MSDYPLGYTGVILRINLTNKEIDKEKIDVKLLNRFIGGRGLNVKFLYDEVKPRTDALGPDNKVIFGVGPCNGTSMTGSQRFNITSKSPLTGFLGDSNCGGDLGAELKYAGYDMVIIEGQSEKPVYIWINDEDIEIREAVHLWGETTFETRRIIEREINDPEACLAMIGPGGENLVLFANVMTELGRSAGRTGMGAVLGSKKVKALAVRGTHGVKVADYEKLKELNKENYKNWKQSPILEKFAKFGPTMGWIAYQNVGMIPTNNFQRATFGTDMLQELEKGNYFVKHKACISCSVGCNHSFIIKNGPYTGTFGEGVELDHLIDFGPKIGNHDIELALALGALTDGHGIDMMDTSGIIAFVMECYENGILVADDLDGLKLEWGNSQAILKLIEMITYRKGIGDVLARGLKKAPEIIGKGSEKYAIHSKGISPPPRQPQASKAWALMYATSSRGACHMRAFVPEGYSSGGAMTPGVFPPEALKTVESYPDALNQLSEEGKPELVKWYEELRAFQDCMEVCRFGIFNANIDSQNKPVSDLMAKYYNAVTGRALSGQDVLRIGERVVNLERAFNLREGLTRKDDSLPERSLKMPLPDGQAKGQVVDLEPMLDRYYEIRGWDKVSGVPGPEKLKDLDLADVAAELAKQR